MSVDCVTLTDNVDICMIVKHWSIISAQQKVLQLYFFRNHMIYQTMHGMLIYCFECRKDKGFKLEIRNYF